jgi:drug/metabolite transporter (DMT)-like permease
MVVSRSQIGIIAAFAAIYLLWGSTYLAVAVALRSMPPFLLMGTRSAVGGLILLACAKLSGGSLGTLKSWVTATICGLLFFVGCHGVLAYAQQRVPSGLAAVLLATIPFWIVLLKAVLPGDDRPKLKLLGVLLPGIVGVGLIAWRQIGASSSGAPIGDILLLVGASASWAVGTVLSERYAGSASRIALSGMELAAGGAVLLMLSIGFDEPASFHIARISPSALAAWGYLVVAGTVVGFAAYIWLLKQVSPTLVATYTFVNPIIAVLLGWLVLGEQPSVWMITGAALVVGSVAALLLADRGSMRNETAWSRQIQTKSMEARR